MVYAKNTWVDGANGGTPVTAARLNNMENGIAAAAVLSDLPIAFLRQATVQSGITTGVFTKITWDTADIDTHSGWTSGANTRWTVPAGQAGYYEVQGIPLINSITAGGVASCNLLKNNVVIPGSGGIWTAGKTDSQSAPTTKVYANLAVGDYLECELYVGGYTGTWGTRAGAADGTYSTFTIKRIR